MKSFQSFQEAAIPKIKWKKVSDGFGRARGGGSTERFKWLSPDGRFEITRATDPSLYGKGRNGNSNRLVWKISDKTDELRKAYTRSFDSAANAKRAAEIIVSKEQGK
jgi:hypothetical protein|tara:strand:+ start:7518 stop:7838 length:321 start_codon:yes stop_codon:yes gene_type:complete